MKYIVLPAITIILLTCSCGEVVEMGSIMKQADTAKPKKDNSIYPSERYDQEDGKNWKIITTTYLDKIGDKVITAITVHFWQEGKEIKSIWKRWTEKMYFIEQIITVDEPGKIALYYMVTDVKNEEFIFHVSFTKGSEPKLEEVHKRDKKEWERIDKLMMEQ